VVREEVCSAAGVLWGSGRQASVRSQVQAGRCAQSPASGVSRKNQSPAGRCVCENYRQGRQAGSIMQRSNVVTDFLLELVRCRQKNQPVKVSLLPCR